MLAVIFDVWLGPQNVGDLLLRTRRQSLVDFQRWDGELIGAGNAVLRGMLKVERHGDPFGR
jgi:hypothetical protein